MGKMKELSTVLDEIVTCGETLVQGAEKLRDMMEIIDGLAECGKALISSGKALKDYFSDTEETKPAAKKTEKKEAKHAAAAKTENTLSKEDVRKVLAEVSQAGHRSEVIELLKKHGADNITALKPELYETVIKEAEGLKDA